MLWLPFSYLDLSFFLFFLVQLTVWNVKKFKKLMTCSLKDNWKFGQFLVANVNSFIDLFKRWKHFIVLLIWTHVLKFKPGENCMWSTTENNSNLFKGLNEQIFSRKLRKTIFYWLYWTDACRKPCSKFKSLFAVDLALSLFQNPTNAKRLYTSVIRPKRQWLVLMLANCELKIHDNCL